MIKKRLKTLFVITLLFSAYTTQAQKDYALTAKGDTLRGELRIVTYDQFDRLQITKDGKRTSYTALQVKGFELAGDIYQSIRYQDTYRFMRIIKSGYLSMYAFSLDKTNSWDGQYLYKKDGKGTEVPNLGFKKIMTKFLSDCPDIKDQIEQGGKRELEKIVDLYNTCIQTKTENLSSAPAHPAVIDPEKILAVKNLTSKVEAEDFPSKKDALDLLRDIQSKVSKNESVPNYLTEGLKSYLGTNTSLTKDLESLIALLKK